MITDTTILFTEKLFSKLVLGLELLDYIKGPHILT